MSTTHATYESDGPIATLTFNRPEARNAMTWDMYQALVDACDRVDDDAGDPGADPQGRRRKGVRRRHRHLASSRAFATPEDGIKYEQRIDQVLDRLERVTKATIAQIQGVAAGGGCAIALTCDLRDRDTRILVRHTGRAHARELPVGRHLQPAGGPARSEVW